MTDATVVTAKNLIDIEHLDEEDRLIRQFIKHRFNDVLNHVVFDIYVSKSVYFIDWIYKYISQNLVYFEENKLSALHATYRCLHCRSIGHMDIFCKNPPADKIELLYGKK